MEKIKHFKIRTKLLLIVAINTFFLLALGACAIVGFTAINQNKEDIVANANALYHQMTADMMHDALRADVYNALLVDKRDAAQVEAVRRDIAEHSKNFRQSLRELEQLRLDPEIQQAVEGTKTPLADYITVSERIVADVFKGDTLAKTATTTLLAHYKQTFDVLAVRMEQLSEQIGKSSDQKREAANRTQWKSNALMCGITLVAIALALVVSLRVTSLLVTPILCTKTTLHNLSQGVLPPQRLQVGADEIGQMAGALNVLVDNLENVRNFSLEVGRGEFDTQVSVFNNQGELGTSLAGMRESLQKIAEDDRRRNWSISGTAQVAEILRKATDKADNLLQEVNVFVINYLQANQGGVFVLEEHGADMVLRLAACYAYERKKFMQKQIAVGEGLVGQCVQEGGTIYLTDLPQGYMSITSGLGGATPGSLLLVPLKTNGQVQGVLEIASFRVFCPHEIEFLEKVAENIAGTISRLKINEKTAYLLEQSQEQAEMMRAQEEEMRQNMEELMATQEEMYRKEREYIEQIEELKKDLHRTEGQAEEWNK